MGGIFGRLEIVIVVMSKGTKLINLFKDNIYLWFTEGRGDIRNNDKVEQSKFKEIYFQRFL